jgi:N-acetylmuramic acid 6-phosphate (MurNAc-6-P) etherase
VVGAGRVDRPRAERLLEDAAGEVKTAIVMARAAIDAEAAAARLAASGGSVRRALEG